MFLPRPYPHNEPAPDPLEDDQPTLGDWADIDPEGYLEAAANAMGNDPDVLHHLLSDAPSTVRLGARDLRASMAKALDWHVGRRSGWVERWVEKRGE